MARKETILVRPPVHDGSQEELELCALDLVINRHYNNYAFIVQVRDDQDKTEILRSFRGALENTLVDCRHIAGHLQKNNHGNISIITNADSTVPLDVQWFDGADDRYPSFEALEKVHFHGASLGDPTSLTIEGMTMSSCASVHINPPVAGFQLTFIPRGVILTVCLHHFAMDVVGASSFVHHLAAHCRSILQGTPRPEWDKSLVDRSRFQRKVEILRDAPTRPPPNLEWKPCSALLFHAEEKKLAELKLQAAPVDGSWVSTYDVLTAFLWRVLLRNRARIYNIDLSSTAIFAESINMRSRVDPPLPEKYQGNFQCAGLSTQQERQFTVAEVISEAPLRELAAYIRKITASVSEQSVEATIAMVSAVRDKSDLYFRQDTMPQTSMIMTDWRDIDVFNADFGFGRPVAMRQLADMVVKNLVVIYPRRTPKGCGPSPGLEVLVPFESHAVDMLLNDPDMSRVFAFRGIDAKDP